MVDSVWWACAAFHELVPKEVDGKGYNSLAYRNGHALPPVLS